MSKLGVGSRAFLGWASCQPRLLSGVLGVTQAGKPVWRTGCDARYRVSGPFRYVCAAQSGAQEHRGEPKPTSIAHHLAPSSHL